MLKMNKTILAEWNIEYSQPLTIISVSFCVLFAQTENVR